MKYKNRGNRIERQKEKVKLKRKIRIGILALMFTLSLLITFLPGMGNWETVFCKLGLRDEGVLFSDAPLKVIFLDVGQGDSTLIIADGETLLIDAGNPENGEDVLRVLNDYSIDRLDYIVSTHPHIDHYGGFEDVLREISASCLLLPEVNCVKMDFWSHYNRFLKVSENVPTKYPEPGYSFNLGKGKVTVLGPLEEDPEANNMSLVLKFEYGECSFLFTGDAEKEEELSLLRSGYDLSANVLKVGHHGSHTSSIESFIDAVSPDIGVIQCGRGNAYGHPNRDTLETLGRHSVTVYRTDTDGTVYMGCDGKKISVKT